MGEIWDKTTKGAADWLDKKSDSRLESLRFFFASGQPEPAKSLLDWMQEVESQLAAIREGNQRAYSTFAKKEPRW